jgi:hypothetical protein
MNKVQFVGLCLTAFMGIVFISNDALAGDGPMLFPMQVGQVWSYHYTNGLGQVCDKNYQVAEKKTFNGKQYYRVTDGIYDMYYRSTTEAVYSWVNGQEKIEFILAPLGTITREYDAEHNGYKYQVVDRYEMVNLGALGNHRAIVYHSFPSFNDGSNGYPPINRIVYNEVYLVPGLV